MEASRFVVLAVLVFVCCIRSGDAQRVAQFIFGDSLVDSGNNDYILSLARANFPPNGVDAPGRVATGRFCNGRLIADYLSEFMGTPSVLPILSPGMTAQDLLRGANFASAGAGILTDTGSIFLRRLTMPEQFTLFQRYQNNLASIVGPQSAANIIANALVSVTIGGNDYINNYLLPNSGRRAQFSTAQFNAFLISNLRAQLVQMYNLGMRRISVSNMGPIGCIPSQKSRNPPNGICISELQSYAVGFNQMLKPLLNGLNQQFPDAVFLYSNGFDMTMDIMTNPGNFGLSDTVNACCGQGAFNGVAVCTASSNVCQDRDAFLWWDPYHPTDKANAILANRVLNGPPSDISPINLRQLLNM